MRYVFRNIREHCTLTGIALFDAAIKVVTIVINGLMVCLTKNVLYAISTGVLYIILLLVFAGLALYRLKRLFSLLTNNAIRTGWQYIYRMILNFILFSFTLSSLRRLFTLYLV